MFPTTVRHLLAAHLGKVLTPELAVQIELAARGVAAPQDRSLNLDAFGTAQCGSVVLAAERLADILPEMHELHKAHWAETERHRHGLVMAPDYDAMVADERAGQMVQFTARRDGQLIGNLRMYIRWSRHTSTRFAVEDTLYLRPEFRVGRTAVRMIEFVHRSMASIGVYEIQATAKLVNRTADLLMHLGYKPVATELVKFLEK